MCVVGREEKQSRQSESDVRDGRYSPEPPAKKNQPKLKSSMKQRKKSTPEVSSTSTSMSHSPSPPKRRQEPEKVKQEYRSSSPVGIKSQRMRSASIATSPLPPSPQQSPPPVKKQLEKPRTSEMATSTQRTPSPSVIQRLVKIIL